MRRRPSLSGRRNQPPIIQLELLENRQLLTAVNLFANLQPPQRLPVGLTTPVLTMPVLTDALPPRVLRRVEIGAVLSATSAEDDGALGIANDLGARGGADLRVAGNADINLVRADLRLNANADLEPSVGLTSPADGVVSPPVAGNVGLGVTVGNTSESGVGVGLRSDAVAAANPRHEDAVGLRLALDAGHGQDGLALSFGTAGSLSGGPASHLTKSALLGATGGKELREDVGLGLTEVATAGAARSENRHVMRRALDEAFGSDGADLGGFGFLGGGEATGVSPAAPRDAERRRAEDSWQPLPEEPSAPTSQSPQGADLVAATGPGDEASLAGLMEQFLGELENLDDELAGLFMRLGINPWVFLTLAAATVAGELARRNLRKNGRHPATPWGAGLVPEALP